jgi:multidrug efflux pump subunit AcrA (membrane-fusion protein)
VVSSSDRSGKILAEITNPDGVLKGGLYARGRVTVEERPNALTLPRIALNGWDLQRARRVFVIDDQDASRGRSPPASAVKTWSR